MTTPRRLLLLLTTILCTSIAACAKQPPAGDMPPVAPTPPPPPQFTDTERADIVTYWSAPGRYKIGPTPASSQVGPWVVRLTPEGSIWLLTYQHAVSGKAKIPPTQDAMATATGPTAGWEPWVVAKLAWDRYYATQAAQAANLAVFPAVIPPAVPPPPAPGPIPPTLLAACGNPPVLARPAAPLQYTVTFDDGDTYPYIDNVRMKDRSAYYRFPNGVATGGVHLKDLPEADRDALFKATGFPADEQRIWESVSALEGGFDAVQTYDTGYISIGFIQFISGSDGHQSLSDVLAEEKTNQPDFFQTDFRRYGIDLRPDRTLVVVDPETGAELAGADAVQKVIDDKRLLAIFQRAGRKTPFRIAQIKVAKLDYWPAADPVTVTLPNGSILTGTVADVVKSDAGLATLLDRKINTGNCRVISDAVTHAMIAHKCTGKSLDEARRYEREIVAACKYRVDFLSDKTLGQPK